jgi:hypothetical protein
MSRELSFLESCLIKNGFKIVERCHTFGSMVLYRGDDRVGIEVYLSDLRSDGVQPGYVQMHYDGDPGNGSRCFQLPIARNILKQVDNLWSAFHPEE